MTAYARGFSEGLRAAAGVARTLGTAPTEASYEDIARAILAIPVTEEPEAPDDYAAEMGDSCGTFKDIPEVPCYCKKSGGWRVHGRTNCWRTIEAWKAAGRPSLSKEPKVRPRPPTPAGSRTRWRRRRGWRGGGPNDRGVSLWGLS